MTSAISKSWAAFGVFSLLVACGGEDPGSANAGGNPATGGGAGVAGASGGTSAGTGGAPGGAGAGGMTGGGTAGAMTGGAAGAGGSAGQAMGGTGGAAGGSMGGMAGMGGMMVLPFVLSTPAFEHVEACQQDTRDPCKFFPKLNCMMDPVGGQNQSPELDWGPGPAGTMSYAITLHDYGNGFTHWAIWNIPAATLQLPANLARNSPLQMPAGAQQKSFNKNDAGYMGPGAFDHVYEFRLYALKVANFTPQNPGDQTKIYDELTADQAKIVLGTSNVRGRSPLN